MDVKTRPCFLENSLSSGARIISAPSSVTISHSTPAGWQPASLQRSTEASVCPSRSNTPPGTAVRGKMCPGREKRAGVDAGSASARNVRARSIALIPVSIPSSFRSIETVNAVHLASSFLATMGGSSNCFARSCSMPQQMTPELCLMMNAMFSLFACSAARMKSPSFSLSSSSTTTTILPFLMSSMAATTESRPKHHRFLASSSTACPSCLPSNPVIVDVVVSIL
mmetsp:Transcript_4198/g.9957  ORF Transcript_4198/g.9957 Transcript_4198/m.9957 type:complete len:225 (+) Transcript_4198:195-869(+)